MGLQAMQPLSLTLDAITVHRFDTAGKGSNEQAAVEDNARKDEAKLELVRCFCVCGLKLCLCLTVAATPVLHRCFVSASMPFCEASAAV